MADSITGLGMTDEEFRSENEVLPIGTVNDRVKEERGRLQFATVRLGDVRMDRGVVVVDGIGSFRYNDLWAMYMGLPASYLSSCGQELRDANLNWWFDRMSDKDALLTIDCGDVTAIDDPERPFVTMEDLMLAVEKPMMRIAVLYDVENMSRSTTADICNRSLVEFGFGGGWQGGIRILQPHSTKGMHAPKLYPYIRSLESSASIAFPPTQTVEVDGRDKDDILEQVASKVDETVALLAEGASSFRHVWDEEARMPVRMAEQVMREHKVHYNTVASVKGEIERLQDNGEPVTVGQMVSILSSYSMQENMAASTRRGLSESAGLYFLGVAEEHRCPTCLQLWERE